MPYLASSRAVLALSQAYLNKGCTTLHPKQNSLASLCQIKMSKRLNTASIDLTTHFRPTSTQRATALVARCTPTTSCPDPVSCTQCWADSGSLSPALTGMRYFRIISARDKPDYLLWNRNGIWVSDFRLNPFLLSLWLVIKIFACILENFRKFSNFQIFDYVSLPPTRFIFSGSVSGVIRPLSGGLKRKHCIEMYLVLKMDLEVIRVLPER